MVGVSMVFQSLLRLLFSLTGKEAGKANAKGWRFRVRLLPPDESRQRYSCQLYCTGLKNSEGKRIPKGPKGKWGPKGQAKYRRMVRSADFNPASRP